MAFESLVRYTLIWMTILAGFAVGIELGENIQAFVPICAQPCLESFISGNYPSTSCTSNPTLQCLCPEKSNSGYTLGEGALQCISAETQQGVCDRNITGGSVQHDAYLMCSGISNALPNTHATLTATIVNSPTGGPGSIILTSIAMTTPTGTLSLAPTVSSTEAAATTTDVTSGSSPEQSSAASLNNAQIAGIVVGVVGTVFISLIAIFIVRRIRKRNYPELEEGLLSIDEDRRKPGASGYRRSGPMIISAPMSSDAARYPEPQSYRTPSPHFAPPLDPYTPNHGPPSGAYLSPGASQEAVGLAISHSLNGSPSRSPENAIRPPPSRPLPAKPALSVKIPPARPPPPETVPQMQSRVSASQTANTDRTSMMTNMTAFADLDAEAQEGGPIWQPPPNEPLSTSPPYVGNRWGNWMFKNNNRQSQLAQVAEVQEVTGAAELDTYTPLTKSPAEREEEAKIAADLAAASVLSRKRQKAKMAKARGDKPVDRSSSVYSQASAVRRNLRSLAPRRNSSRSRKSNGAQISRSNTAASQDSVTTINTCSSSPLPDDVLFELDNGRLSELSTVRETSPSPRGPQVRYPKIPGRLDRSMMQMDPPKRPEFIPRGKPSPILRDPPLPIDETNSPYPQPLNPKRLRDPRIQNLAGDPDIGTDLASLPRLDEDRPMMDGPSSRFSPRMANTQDRTGPYNYPGRLLTPPIQTTGSGFSPEPPNVERFPTPPSISSQSGMGDIQSHVARSVSPLGPGTMSSGTSNSSTLLAKRVGKGKATTLTLTGSNKKKVQWTKQNDEADPDNTSPSPPPRGPPPPTPTWQPKLTPTRFGDELYLNVQ
ncbi:uncharacterized protein F4822DRAFT_206984 [Hypoxylon trugodes]|uniref:uncharacterized protein n=1 Tax=Hypoxylon trugodes TaxID=326681 RepID=UPI0021A217A1|nr:uncharacterized protein F4822DRAFT_206984 [Hypoxylon trugodes]KAI1389641.1 hypothetical protein F4822DRAFT_206984 [Hypoxylon trugodes]